jgi:hypothetical protein
VDNGFIILDAHDPHPDCAVPAPPGQPVLFGFSLPPDYILRAPERDSATGRVIIRYERLGTSGAYETAITIQIRSNYFVPQPVNVFGQIYTTTEAWPAPGIEISLSTEQQAHWIDSSGYNFVQADRRHWQGTMDELAALLQPLAPQPPDTGSAGLAR